MLLNHHLIYLIINIFVQNPSLKTDRRGTFNILLCVARCLRTVDPNPCTCTVWIDVKLKVSKSSTQTRPMGQKGAMLLRSGLCTLFPWNNSLTPSTSPAMSSLLHAFYRTWPLY
jgi:hypothetical protein